MTTNNIINDPDEQRRLAQESEDIVDTEARAYAEWHGLQFDEATGHVYKNVPGDMGEDDPHYALGRIAVECFETNPAWWTQHMPIVMVAAIRDILNKTVGGHQNG